MDTPRDPQAGNLEHQAGLNSRSTITHRPSIGCPTIVSAHCLCPWWLRGMLMRWHKPKLDDLVLNLSSLRLHRPWVYTTPCFHFPKQVSPKLDDLVLDLSSLRLHRPWVYTTPCLHFPKQVSLKLDDLVLDLSSLRLRRPAVYTYPGRRS